MLDGGSSAHSGEVVGIACDSTNTLMISAGQNGDIKVYKTNDVMLMTLSSLNCFFCNYICFPLHRKAISEALHPTNVFTGHTS